MLVLFKFSDTAVDIGLIFKKFYFENLQFTTSLFLFLRLTFTITRKLKTKILSGGNYSEPQIEKKDTIGDPLWTCNKQSAEASNGDNTGQNK